MEARYKRLIKNTSFILFGGALTKIVSLLMLPFYTNWLSVADYGTTDIITVYATLLTGLSTLAIAEAMFIYPKGASVKDQKRYFSSAIVFTLLLLLGVAAFFYLISYLGDVYKVQNSFVTYIWLIYGIIFSSFCQTLTQQFACAIDAMKVYSFTGLVYVVILAGTAFCMVPGRGVYGYVYSMILANLFASGYTILFARLYKYVSIHSVSWASYKSMVRYSIPLIPNSLMFWLVSSFNRPFLESYVGVAGIGLFAIANRFSSVLSMVFQYFATSWQVSVCEEYGKEGFERFYNRILRFLFLFLICCAMLIAVFSRELLVVFSTSEYYSASVYIAPLCLAVIFNCMAGLTGGIFAVTKHSKYFFYTSVWGAIASLLVNILTIPLMDIWGAVCGVIVSFLVIWLTRIAYARRYIRLFYAPFYFVLIICFVFFTILTYVNQNLVINLFVFLSFCIVLIGKKEVRLKLYNVIQDVKRKLIGR